MEQSEGNIAVAEEQPVEEQAASVEPVQPEGDSPDENRESEAPDTGEEVLSEQLLIVEEPADVQHTAEAHIKAMLEAAVYIADEPLSAAQMATALGQSVETVTRLLDEIAAEFQKPEHGLTIREVAGGYKMATKPEHHEAIRAFVKGLKPPLKLSLAALETLAVIAYKQPITAPEIMEIRGVQGAGVLKTLLDRKLIASGGRKQVLGKPILYKTTKDFLVQFGLKDLSELPTLKEFEELGRFALSEPELPSTDAASEPVAEEEPQSPMQDPETQKPPEVDPPQELPPDKEPPSEPPPVHEPPENPPMKMES